MNNVGRSYSLHNFGDILSIFVRQEVPEHHIRFPTLVLLVIFSLLQHLVQSRSLNKASVVRVSLGDWLSQHYFLGLDSLGHQFVYCCLWVEEVGLDEKGVIGVIGSVALVVELYVVEVYFVADLSVDSQVGSSLGKSGGEVGTLRGVRHNVERQFLSQLLHEKYEPVLSSSSKERLTILEINVNTISLILHDKLSKFFGTVERVVSFGGGELGIPKGADQQFIS